MEELAVSLPDLAEQINEAHIACAGHAEHAVYGAIAVGQLLWQAKTRVKAETTGRWLPWVEQYCQFSRQQAAGYMMAFRNRHVIESKMEAGALHFAGLKGALKAIRQTNSRAPIDHPNGTAGLGIVGSLQELIDRGERFSTIYADPPWQYGNQATRASTDNHYGTMTVEQICNEPVSELAEDNAHLHLWTTNAFLNDAFDVIDAWGFVYKSCFVWVKPQMGIGNYWRVSHEFLLLGIRGKTPFRERDEKSWGVFDRGEHSAKPDEIRQKIERVSPGPYLEMYGRQSPLVSSWTVYGNQVERSLW